MATIPDIIQTAYTTARAGRPQQAVEDLKRSLRVHADDPDLHEHLGLILMQMGQTDQSMYHLQRATIFAPARADYHNNYATALNMQGKTKEAAEGYRKALNADKASFQGHLGLSSALYGLMDYPGAIESSKAAMQLNPRTPEPAINLGLALTRSGQGAEAVKVLTDAAARVGDNPMLLMNLAMALNYRPEPSAQDVSDVHMRLGRAMAAAAGASSPLFPDMRPDRRLHIGYLCADFPDRAVAWFLKPILSAHDRDKFDVFCYSGRPRTEPDVAGLSSLATWVDSSAMYDPTLEQRIRADKIDVLVALCAHGPMGRLPILARRAAPVQVAYLGCPGTTGIKAIHWRIVDATTDGGAGSEADSLSAEKLVRLEGSSFCYAPPTDAPEVSSRGGGQAVTFACLGNPQKINDQVLDAWAAILKAVPESRLLLKHQTYEAAATREHFQQSLSDRGIAPDRLDVETHTPDFRDHLNTYARVDVALDTFPYNGMATTCEALWMGVPVVTLAGDRHSARMGLSILTAAGLPELASDSPPAYIAAATSLAKDTSRRAELRRTVRDRIRSSPLCDGAAITRQLEEHYRTMWKAFCGSVYYAGEAEPVQFVKE